MVAAFIKRFARLSLSAPPAGALVSLALIANLLRRNPSSRILISRTADRKFTIPSIRQWIMFRFFNLLCSCLPAMSDQISSPQNVFVSRTAPTLTMSLPPLWNSATPSIAHFGSSMSVLMNFILILYYMKPRMQFPVC